jgi:hypothetical protein
MLHFRIEKSNSWLCCIPNKQKHTPASNQEAASAVPRPLKLRSSLISTQLCVLTPSAGYVGFSTLHEIYRQTKLPRLSHPGPSNVSAASHIQSLIARPPTSDRDGQDFPFCIYLMMLLPGRKHTFTSLYNFFSHVYSLSKVE